MSFVRRSPFVVALFAAIPAALESQDRLPTMPGYAQFAQVAPIVNQVNQQINSQRVSSVTWLADGSGIEYTVGGQSGKRFRYVFATKAKSEIPFPTAGSRAGAEPAVPQGSCSQFVDRGRQAESELSPDGTKLAVYRDRNLYLTTPADCRAATGSAITTDGSVKDRIKYGTASWVYGEELEQTSAFWWSPDSKKLAYYRFDESRIPDYYLQIGQTGIYDTVDVEAYPKTGYPNPVVDLFVYDVATKKSTRIDVRDGKPFTNDVVGHYVYNVAWTPDGREITFNRKNRRQNVLELTFCDPTGGKCRVVVREEWPTGWLENHTLDDDMIWLADGQRFLWTSHRNGFENYYLYDRSGKLLNPVTQNLADLAKSDEGLLQAGEGAFRVDEKAGILWYTARDGGNYMKVQLHRVGLDGRNDKRLTDTAFTHSVSVSPDGRYFLDIAQTHDVPPITRIIDRDGNVVVELARADAGAIEKAGLRKTEMFTFLSADGKTRLHGTIKFPSNFDPMKKYPALLSVYGGPNFSSVSENFAPPSTIAEFGFLTLTVDTRASKGQGHKLLDDLYLKLGIPEIDDMAAAVRSLASRPYFDGSRVGIFGTSYGGYASLMALLRYPSVFAAASSSSPVTDWRNYDTIYTERYMWIPQENAAGYDAGSTNTYAGALKGDLLLYYGSADNNVHPNNTMQMVRALQAARKHFELQVGPDQGHTPVDQQRMLEFFIENLKMKSVERD
jgi:dipeptidyl-peptidase-4